VNRGLLAIKGTPPDVMAKLEAACAAAAKEPAFAAAMKDQGTLVNYLNAKDYAEFLKKNDVLNRDLAKDLGMLKR
jgi:tripartite-type tricarboxylate transporter receptor subunit TctC